ncbi:ASCH domain-containing protein [Bombilactobacillus folatiphilus]|uniref:ASCH domain-containing protein n=1 Tax=Bombilactobacillus folatiphilus TaxID=2923362 RepID=A0ABY4P8T8_9LACO|nr:ASCH domain-containing protein [Bombilactobacillus folatiphilus]UQS82145.1 ASCH domain-containing protein [Bombilactobacillus folatiphilus]
MDTKIQTFWQNFQQQHQVSTNKYEAWSFGANPQMADELAQLVLSGQKTATTSALETYESNEPLPKVGEYNIILDGQNQPVCVTQTKVVEIIPFDQVSAEHAYHEGEGDRTYDYWRRVHVDFFETEYQKLTSTFNLQIPCVCEVFEVVK